MIKKLQTIIVFVGMILNANFIVAGTATIDASTTYQYIRGFGGCSAWHNGAYAGAAATLFWDGTGMSGNNPTGIGMSLLRCHIPYDGSDGEIPVMKQAAGFGVTQIWAASWTPPTTYKQNGLTHGSNNNNNFTGAASGAANSADTGYATYLVNYIKNCNTQLNSYGIKLLAVSPQNEPDWDTDYESALWSAGQFAVFAKELYSQLQTANLTTKIMIPESFRDDKTLAATAMNDATIAPMIGVIGNHLYGITSNLVLSSTPYSLANSGFSHVTNQEMWETEMSDVSGAGNDSSITSGLVIAGWIQQCIVGASMNAYHHWWIRAYDGSSDTNEVLIPQSNAATKKLWCLGNWSRFVRPGYYRIGATVVPSSGVSLSAFENSTTAPTTLVIVAINNNSSTVSQTFTFTTATTVTQVTPWITDANNNLTRQTAVAVTGNSFTYTLTSKSVITFVANVGAVGPTSTPTNTLPPTATPTRTLTPIPGASCMIDNFEDGDKVNNWGGTWTTYGDSGTTLTLTEPTGGATGSTSFSLSCSGSVSSYGGVSCPLGGTVDLSRYTAGIVFYAKGSGTYWFQMDSAAVTDGDNFGVSFTTNTAWTPVTVLFSQLAQRGFGTAVTFSPSQVTTFQWASAAAGTYNLQLDDVKMLGAYCPGGTATFTSTPTRTATLTPTATSSSTRTMTGTPTFSPTATSSATSTPTTSFTPTRTNTATSTFTSTRSSTPTLTWTSTGTATPTTTSTYTTTPTYTSTRTSTATETNTLTSTATRSSTSTLTWTSTGTATPTYTSTSTATQSSTPTVIWTSTATNTGTVVPISTNTTVPSPTMTGTFSATVSYTSTETQTASVTSTATSTVTAIPPTVTSTPTATDSFTSTPTGWSTATWTSTSTATGTPTVTATMTSTATSSSTASRTSTETRTPSGTATATPTGIVTSAWTWTATASATSTATSTFSATPTYTFTATATPTFSSTPTDSNTSTPTRTWTVTSSATSTATSTSSATPSATSSRTSTSTLTATSTFTASFTPSVTVTWTSTRTGTATATVTSSETPTATSTSIPSDCPGVILSKPYPNPVTCQACSVKFDLRSNCPKTLHWTISTSASRLMASGTVSFFGRATLAWDQRDNHGKWVANGLYYFRLQEAGHPDQWTKILILH